MTHLNQSCTLAAILFLTASLSGCGNENERSAKITGTVDSSQAGVSPTESKGRMRGASKDLPKSYPGAGGANRK